MNKKRFYIGLTGFVISALCCFTPLVTVVFGAIGLSALFGWLDYVLLPALFIFALLTIHAVVSKT